MSAGPDPFGPQAFLMSPAWAGPTTLGLELTQTAALAQIMDFLPDELARLETDWSSRDRYFAERTERPYRPTVLERPPKGSYYSGVRMGVLGMPWDTFPAVAVMADTATPSVFDASLDQGGRAFTNSLYIEAVVRSDAFPKDDMIERVEQEGLLDRRAKRMLEALVQCIDRDVHLGGASATELPSPRARMTDPFTIESTTEGDQNYSRVFSIIRIEYNLDAFPARRDASSPAPYGLPAHAGAS